MIEDDGERLTFARAVRQSERYEPAVNNRRWEMLVAEKRSRCKLAVDLSTRGLEQKIMDLYATIKIHAINLPRDATEAVSLSKGCQVTSEDGARGDQSRLCR